MTIIIIMFILLICGLLYMVHDLKQKKKEMDEIRKDLDEMWKRIKKEDNK